MLAAALAAAGAGTGYMLLRGKGLLGDADATSAAARIGAAFLAQYPQEKDTDALARALFGVDARALGSLDPPRIREKIAAAAAADFGAGHVIDLDGWVVSRAEGRAGALVHLLEG